MQKRRTGAILDRKKGPRTALLRGLATSVILHEHVNTTLAKAKAVRPIVEKLITTGRVKSLTSRRRLMQTLLVESAVNKVLEELGPRYAQRPGGYTRILKLGHRRGDAAEIAQIELVGSEFDPKKAEADKAAREAEAETPKQQKSVGERLKAAAQSIRGGKKDAAQADATRGKASRPARGAAKKSTTPRKAGGS